jgi:hypothetical protein
MVTLGPLWSSIKNTHFRPTWLTYITNDDSAIADQYVTTLRCESNAVSSKQCAKESNLRLLPGSRRAAVVTRGRMDEITSQIPFKPGCGLIEPRLQLWHTG